MKKISMNFPCAGLAAALAAFAFTAPAAHAQSAPHDMHGMPPMNMPDQPAKQPIPPAPDQSGAEPKMRMDAMPGMDHGSMDHGNMKHGSMDRGPSWAMPAQARPPSGHSGKQDTKQGTKEDMQMGPMQGGSPPPDARDPNAYADGMRMQMLPGMDMADDALYGRLLINELEYADGRYGNGQYLDAEAWYGGDYNKLWLKAEAERRNGRLESSRTEALWDRVFATYWSTQLGIRHDTGAGRARDWLAFGVQGLAPYWFETTATAYVSGGGMLAARAEARYELLFTQRLILEPRLEANLYSKDDAARGIGSGLSDMSFALRLRYEIRRQFAPYVGVAWKNKFGNTADMARSAGEPVHDVEAVAGVRIWF